MLMFSKCAVAKLFYAKIIKTDMKTVLHIFLCKQLEATKSSNFSTHTDILGLRIDSPTAR